MLFSWWLRLYVQVSYCKFSDIKWNVTVVERLLWLGWKMSNSMLFHALKYLFGIEDKPSSNRDLWILIQHLSHNRCGKYFHRNSSFVHHEAAYDCSLFSGCPYLKMWPFSWVRELCVGSVEHFMLYIRELMMQDTRGHVLMASNHFLFYYMIKPPLNRNCIVGWLLTSPEISLIPLFC